MELHSDIIRGHIDTIILSVLMSSDNYGYNIVKQIYRKSNETFELKEPTLYSSLRRLESQGLVQSYWGEHTQGGRRKYYRLTEQGRLVYQSNEQAWSMAKGLIDRLIAVEDGGGIGE